MQKGCLNLPGESLIQFIKGDSFFYQKEGTRLGIGKFLSFECPERKKSLFIIIIIYSSLFLL